jgi:mersacidin/lichenicidin family type 2 lantibiotic
MRGWRCDERIADHTRELSWKEDKNMKNIHSIVTAWRNPEDREAGDLLPASPAGLMEVSDDFLAGLSGGQDNDKQASPKSAKTTYEVYVEVQVGPVTVGAKSSVDCEGALCNPFGGGESTPQPPPPPSGPTGGESGHSPQGTGGMGGSNGGSGAGGAGGGE